MCTLKELAEYYHQLLLEYGGGEFKSSRYAYPYILAEKIKRHFKSSIVVQKNSTGHTMVYSAYLSPNNVQRKIKSSCFSTTELEKKVRYVALKLREDIKSAERCPLTENVTVRNLCNGEVKAPQLLSNFFQYLIGGPDPRSWHLPQKSRRIESLIEDSIFCATSGRVKPKKHHTLGVAVESSLRYSIS